LFSGAGERSRRKARRADGPFDIAQPVCDPSLRVSKRLERVSNLFRDLGKLWLTRHHAAVESVHHDFSWQEVALRIN
jgi:hypothetical protein